MNRLVLATLSLFLIGGAVPTATPGVILTGSWLLESVSGTQPRSSGAGVSWGPDFIALHEDQKLTVVTGISGRISMKTYRLDGVDEITKPERCNAYGLTTNAVWREKILVITEKASYLPCSGDVLNPTVFGPARFPKADYSFVSSITSVSMPSADTLTLVVTVKPDAGEPEVTSLRKYRRKAVKLLVLQSCLGEAKLANLDVRRLQNVSKTEVH